MENSFKIFAVDDDVNAVCKPIGAFNNNGTPSRYCYPSTPLNLAVGSPSRTPKSSTAHLGVSPARVLAGNSLQLGTPKRVIRSPPNSSSKKTPVCVVRQPPFTTSSAPRSVNQSGRSATSTARPSSTALLLSQKRGNNNNGLFGLEDLSLNGADQSLSEFEHSILSREDYLTKTGHLNDAFKERQECSLISEIIDNEVGVDKAYELLSSADLKMALAFIKSHRGSRHVRDSMDVSLDFRRKISLFIIQNKLVNELSFSPSGNFVVQRISGLDFDIDKALVDQLVKQMRELTVDKYGCRVTQVVIENVHPDLVRRLITALEGFELRVCLDKNGTHVIQCLLFNHTHDIYERFFYPFVSEEPLRLLMEDKFGCRIVQKCLEALAKEVTSNYVPQILNDLIIPLLKDSARYTSNEFANYVIQFIISSPSYKRQRDYIIDHVLLHNLLRLSQGKFSSHVVEAALNYACPPRLDRMCNEIFHDYKIVEKGRIPLEILMFDQFGNYVVQKLLQIAIEVSLGQHSGDPSWLNILKAAVMRNEGRLKRYSSGKKILEILAKTPTVQHQHPAMYLYGNYYHHPYY